jgi:WXG100 family type VII secretion target
MAGDIAVTYQAMEAAAKQLQSGEAEIISTLNKLKALVNELVTGGFVTDAASKQFDASYTEFNKGATQTIQGLNGMGQYLTSAARAYQDTDTQLAKSLK